jgi:hypothetical protein
MYKNVSPIMSVSVASVNFAERDKTLRIRWYSGGQGEKGVCLKLAAFGTV